MTMLRWLRWKLECLWLTHKLKIEVLLLIANFVVPVLFWWFFSNGSGHGGLPNQCGSGRYTWDC